MSTDVLLPSNSTADVVHLADMPLGLASSTQSQAVCVTSPAADMALIVPKGLFRGVCDGERA